MRRLQEGSATASLFGRFSFQTPKGPSAQVTGYLPKTRITIPNARPFLDIFLFLCGSDFEGTTKHDEQPCFLQGLNEQLKAYISLKVPYKRGLGSFDSPGPGSF